MKLKKYTVFLLLGLSSAAHAQEKCVIPSGGEAEHFCERLQSSIAKERSPECRLQLAKIMNQNECHSSQTVAEALPAKPVPIAKPSPIKPRRTVETNVVSETPGRQQVRTVEIEIRPAPAQATRPRAEHRMPKIIIVDHQEKPNGDVETKSKPVRSKREAQITVTPWMHD